MKYQFFFVLFTALAIAGCSERVIGYDDYDGPIDIAAIDPNKIITYTTDDERMVYVYNPKKTFGAKIVHHRYGLIIFDRPVSKSGRWGVTLESITLPNSVEEIVPFAFSECNSLTSITIPDGVTKIELCAFENCARLWKVIIPSGVTEIEYKAFYGCSRLDKVYCMPRTPPYVGEYAFEDRCVYVSEYAYSEYQDSEAWRDYLAGYYYYD